MTKGEINDGYEIQNYKFSNQSSLSTLELNVAFCPRPVIQLRLYKFTVTFHRRKYTKLNEDSRNSTKNHHQGTRVTWSVILSTEPIDAVHCRKPIWLSVTEWIILSRTWGTIVCLSRNRSLVFLRRSSRPRSRRNLKKGREFSWNASTLLIQVFNTASISAMWDDKNVTKVCFHWWKCPHTGFGLGLR